MIRAISHRRAASDLKESNMLKTMPALSLGFLLAGTAASNAGLLSRTLMHNSTRSARHIIGPLACAPAKALL